MRLEVNTVTADKEGYNKEVIVTIATTARWG
jgi:hypothetical protein